MAKLTISLDKSDYHAIFNPLPLFGKWLSLMPNLASKSKKVLDGIIKLESDDAPKNDYISSTVDYV